MSKAVMMAKVPPTSVPAANKLFGAVPAQHHEEVSDSLDVLQQVSGIPWDQLMDWAVQYIPPIVASGSFNFFAAIAAVRALWALWRASGSAPAGAAVAGS